jgi:hypothetical protein
MLDLWLKAYVFVFDLSINTDGRNHSGFVPTISHLYQHIFQGIVCLLDGSEPTSMNLNTLAYPLHILSVCWTAVSQYQ